MVKNLPSNAGDVDSIPSRGAKILHAVRQLNPSTTNREPVHCNQGPAQPKLKKKKKGMLFQIHLIFSASLCVEV